MCSLLSGRNSVKRSKYVDACELFNMFWARERQLLCIFIDQEGDLAVSGMEIDTIVYHRIAVQRISWQEEICPLLPYLRQNSVKNSLSFVGSMMFRRKSLRRRVCLQDLLIFQICR